MAKSNAKTERLGFSDYDFDAFGDFELGGFEDSAPVRNDRNPAVAVAGRFVKGSTEALQNQDFQRNIIKHALPKGYLRTYDAARDANSVLQDIRYEAKSGLDQLVDTTKRTIQPLTNKLDRVLPKEMATRVKDWSRSARDDGNYRYDASEFQRAEMQDTLREIFGGWDAVKNDINRDRSNQTMTTDAALDLLNDDVTQKLQATSNEELGRIRVILERGQDYNNRVSHRFREKSLEVAYKTMWSVAAIADLTKRNLEQQKAANDRIVKNTALPEAVKIHNSELAWQLMKERSFGGIVENVGNTFDNMRRKLVEKTRKEVNSFFREAVGTVSTVGMFTRTIDNDDFDDYDPNETEEERRKRKAREELTGMAGSAAEHAGSHFAKKYGRKLGDWIKSNYGDNPEVTRVGLALSNFLDSAPTYLNDSLDRRKKSGSEAFDYVRNMLGLDTLKYKEETAVRKSSLADLDQMATFNVRTQRTINEIIPGWLSRIHNEIRMHRTGTDGIEPLRWSFESNSFEETTQSMERLRRQLFNRDSMASTANDLNNVIAEIDPDAKLSANARNHLRDYLVQSVYSPDKRITLETLSDYASTLDPGAKKEIDNLRKELTDKDISFFSSSVMGGIKSDFTGSREEQIRRARILAAMENARSGIPTNVHEIIKRAKGGDMDILAKSGLLQQNDKGEWHYSNDALKNELTQYTDMVGPRSPYRRGFASGGTSAGRADAPGDSPLVKKVKGYLRKFNPEQLAATVAYVKAQRDTNHGVRNYHGPYKEFASKVPKDFVNFLEANRDRWNASIFPLIEEFASAPDGINTADLSDGIPANNRGGTGGPTGSGALSKITGVTHAHEHVIRAKSALEPGARDFLNKFNVQGMGALKKVRDAGAQSGIGAELAPVMERTNDLLQGVQVAVSDMALNGITVDPDPDIRARKRRFTKALVKKHFNAKDVLSPTFIAATVMSGGSYALGDLGYRSYKFAKDYAAREALDQSDLGMEALERLTRGMEQSNPMLRRILLTSAKGATKVAKNRQDISETIGERQGEWVDKILDRIEERKAKQEGKEDTRNTTDKDGDGLRDNSWQEVKARRDATAANGSAVPVTTVVESPKKSSMLSLMTSLVGMVGAFIPSVTAWGSRLMNWGGTALKLLRTIATGKAIGNIAGAAGDFISGRGKGKAGKLGRVVRKMGTAGKVVGLAGLAGGGYALSQMSQPDTTETMNVGYGIQREFDIDKAEQGESSWTDKALDWGGTALTVGSVASLANMVTGGAVYSGIGALATGAAGLLTAPVLIGAAAVGAIGFGGYLLYKKLKADSSYCLNFRMAQYGFSHKNDDAVANILAMEEYLLKHTSVSAGKGATLGKSAQLIELLKIFKIEPTDTVTVARFINWLAKRFKPIYLGAVTSLFNINGSKDLLNADTILKPEQKIQYINNSDITSSVAESPYNEMANPMPRAKVLQIDATDIGNYKTTALSKLEKASTKESAESQTKRENRETAEKVLPKDGTAGAASWQDQTKQKADDRRAKLSESIKDFFSGAADKAKEFGQSVAEQWEAGKEYGAKIIDKLTGGTKANQLAVYKAFINAGFSKNQALALTAEVGRENGYQAKALWGGHIDAAKDKNGNRIANLGFISWNRDRRDRLVARAKAAGVLSGPNQIAESQEGLNVMAKFVMEEMRSPLYAKNLAPFLNNPNIDPESAAPILGKKYIGWAYGQDKLRGGASFDWRKHDAKRRGYLDQIKSQIGNGDAAGGPAPEKAGGGNTGTGGAAFVPYKPSVMADKSKANPLGNKGGAVATAAGGFAGVAGPSAPGSSAGASNSPTIVPGGYTAPTVGAAAVSSKALDPKLIEYGKKQAVRENSGVELTGMNSDFMRYVYALIGDWSKANAGRKVVITSAFRSKEKQYLLWYNYKYKGGNLAAAPGKSKHEFGIAIDISPDVANSMASQGLLTKYGFTRPLLNHKTKPEPWHLEHKLFGKPGETQKAVADAAQAKPKAGDVKKMEASEKTVAQSPKAATDGGIKAKPMVGSGEISPIGKGSNGQPTAVTKDAASVGSRQAPIASGGQFETPTAPTPRSGGDRNTNGPNADMMAKQQLEIMNSMNVNLVKIVDTLGRIEKGGSMKSSGDDTNATAAKIANTIAQSINTTLDGRQKSQDLRPPVSLRS